jgi:hypothetical protein
VDNFLLTYKAKLDNIYLLVNNKKTMKTITNIIFTIATIDITILAFMVLGIMSGADVQHIPFWDMQLKFIISLFV